MIDFDFKFRWLRLLYIGFLAGFIFFLAGLIPALICMLAVFDITIDDGLLNSEDDDDSGVAESDVQYGPKPGDDHV